MILKSLDPLSSLTPKFIRKWIGLSASSHQADLVSARGCILRPGGLGDLVILSMAALSLKIDIRKVLWLVETRNKSWCELLKMPFVCYDEYSILPLIIPGKPAFSWAIDSEQTFGLSALLASRLVSAQTTIVGFRTSRASQLYDIKVDHPLANVHELQTFRDLLKQADQKLSLPKLQEDISFTPKELECDKASHVILALGGRQAKERRLDLDVWVNLAKLAHQYSDQIYLVGHLNDRKFAEEIVKKAPWINFNHVGTISFNEVARLIKSAQRVVGIDSGLIHVASFFDTPASALFVDRKKKDRWAPLAGGSVSLMLEDLN